MSTTAATDAGTSDALAAGLLGVETSRKVGWAKAFDALRQVDVLSEDLRQTRDELKYLRRAYSRLLGLVSNIKIDSTEVFKEELRAHLNAERSFRQDDAWDGGVAIAWEHRALLNNWTPEEKIAHKLDWAKAEAELRAKKLESRKAKVWIRELYYAAVEKGHSIECLPYDSKTSYLGVCTCGESSGLQSQEESVVAWKREHIAQVVHGIGFVELQRKHDS